MENLLREISKTPDYKLKIGDNEIDVLVREWCPKGTMYFISDINHPNGVFRIDNIELASP